jgi:glycosyltransferase involved in cell wall biosynthesis
MKILLIHNNYREIGGEDIAVDNEIRLLKEKHDVSVIKFDNNIENIFVQIFYFLINKNLKSIRILKEEIIRFNPDCVYVHNTWFKASLGIFKILKKSNINTIIKLHNFRYSCTRSFRSTYHLHNDEFCLKCGYTEKGIGNINKYFKDSYIKSLLVTHYGKEYFKILKDPFFKIAVLTNFHKKYLENLDFQNKIFVFHNYLEIKDTVKKEVEDNYLIYAGRISSEKGVQELINSFTKSKLSNFNLKIIGEGPLSLDLDSCTNIEFLGRLENDKVLKLVGLSAAVVSATKLFEGQPNLLCEASSLGIPSIFPKSGGIEEFFPKDYILSFEQYNYDDLIDKLNFLQDEILAKEIGLKNKAHIKEILKKDSMHYQFEKMVKS